MAAGGWKESGFMVGIEAGSRGSSAPDESRRLQGQAGIDPQGPHLNAKESPASIDCFSCGA